MKKDFLKRIIIAVVAVMFTVTIHGQQPQSTEMYRVFAISEWTVSTGDITYPKEYNTTIKITGNRLHLGDEIYYNLYNKNIDHDGFVTITDYDFIDKYNQHGIITIRYNPNRTISKYFFYIVYKGHDTGMQYYSDKM